MSSKRVVLAPLRGITTYTYRNVFKENFGGIDDAISPFISTTKDRKVSIKLVKDILPKNNVNGYPLVPQILGNNAEDLIPFVEKIKELGYSEINWNLGCPAPMVTKKIKGSGLLPRPDIVENYLKVLSSIEGIDYTVKVRAGLEKNDDIFKLLPLFEEYNCKEITVHPRTGFQLYRGEADRDIFEKVYNSTSLPLIFNGDIFSIEDYKIVTSRFPDIIGVMLGRGVLINPFLPAQIKGDSIPDSPNKLIYSFMQTLFDEYSKVLYGDFQIMGKMKELWKYMEFSFPEAKRDIKKILKTTSVPKYQKRVDQLFESHTFTPPKAFCDLEAISGAH
jgi:tRNA-dihydrouridine synthase B